MSGERPSGPCWKCGFPAYETGNGGATWEHYLTWGCANAAQTATRALMKQVADLQEKVENMEQRLNRRGLLT